jgi:hypothetical protein
MMGALRAFFGVADACCIRATPGAARTLPKIIHAPVVVSENVKDEPRAGLARLVRQHEA